MLPADHADHTEEHSAQTGNRTGFDFSSLSARELRGFVVLCDPNRVPLRSGGEGNRPGTNDATM